MEPRLVLSSRFFCLSLQSAGHMCMHPYTQQVWNTALELLRQSVDRKTENTNKTGSGRDHGFLNGNGQRDRETR